MVITGEWVEELALLSRAEFALVFAELASTDGVDRAMEVYAAVYEKKREDPEFRKQEQAEIRFQAILRKHLPSPADLSMFTTCMKNGTPLPGSLRRPARLIRRDVKAGSQAASISASST